MADLLYLWPAAAEFGSRVPEGKFFDHPAFTPAVREKFASEVQCVTWRYKLAEATIDLQGTADVPEVQVLRIDARDADVSKQVLTAIDKAIPFPIVFEIARSPGERREVRMAAALQAARGAHREDQPVFHHRLAARRRSATAPPGGRHAALPLRCDLGIAGAGEDPPGARTYRKSPQG